MRRSGRRFSANIWPGFVDAMTALLLVLMFVLTIFMVVQFVLRETISGQDEELNLLSSEIEGLAAALGLERDRSDDLQSSVALLTTSLSDAEQAARDQQALISSLTFESESQKSRIAGFEEQVAGLLARNTDLSATLENSQSRVAILTQQQADLEAQNETLSTAVADEESRNAALAEERRLLLADKDALERANLQVITEKDALQLALAQARDEIDVGVETARLAAAKREALEALIADLQSDVAGKEGSLASALANLAASQDSLTARQAEVEASQTELAAKTVSEAALQKRLEELAQGLSDAEKAQLAEAAAAAALKQRLAGAEDELTAMTLSLEAQRKKAEDTLTLLAAAQVAQIDAETQAAGELSERQKNAALLAQANSLLSEEKALSAESQRKVALLNQQTVELRKQLDSLQGLLDQAGAADIAAKVQIKSLGANLNTALARLAAEQKKVASEQTKLASEQTKLAVLEEKERLRLEEEAKTLKKFRSEFFGRLRDVLGTQEGIRIVGDRFVFSSEILFDRGSAELGDRGKQEIRKVAGIILGVADEIPPEINWILRVDGHTDKIPLVGTGRYRDNWELSQGRALSVVKYLIDDLGVPPGRLAANGFGEFQPIAIGDSPEVLAANRRIELKFTEK
ncbi:MAG: peptidoglycan -binding protein [Rhodobacteraceae bacterium]|nr:peptidoglycan -binding protein [Paracoccaceae bacterium]